MDLEQILAQIKERGLEREVFMHLYRESNELSEQMTSADCEEVFMGILKGESDLSMALFENVCFEYGTTLNDVLDKSYYEVVYYGV